MTDGHPNKQTDWMQKANCKGHTHLFFGKPKEHPRDKRKREIAARQLCEECAVQDQCRRYARSHDEFGIWGGETEEQRIDLGYMKHAVLKRKISRRLDNLKNNKD